MGEFILTKKTKSRIENKIQKMMICESCGKEIHIGDVTRRPSVCIITDIGICNALKSCCINV